MKKMIDEKKQINALAADIFSMFRSDSMSRAMASMLYGEGYRKIKWISVEERLPDPNEYDWVLGALITTELPDGCNYYLPPHIVELRNGEWWTMATDFPLKDLHAKVTHWMPLPELPKGDAE